MIQTEANDTLMYLINEDSADLIWSARQRSLKSHQHQDGSSRDSTRQENWQTANHSSMEVQRNHSVSRGKDCLHRVCSWYETVSFIFLSLFSFFFFFFHCLQFISIHFNSFTYSFRHCSWLGTS